MCFPPEQPDALLDHLVPDELWHAIRPLLTVTRTRPQGGGKGRIDDRPLLAAVVYVVSTGTAWRKLPPWCAGNRASIYRRFTDWTRDEVWDRLLNSLDPDHAADCWCRTIATLAIEHAAQQPARQVHKRPQPAAEPGWERIHEVDSGILC